MKQVSADAVLGPITTHSHTCSSYSRQRYVRKENTLQTCLVWQNIESAEITFKTLRAWKLGSAMRVTDTSARPRPPWLASSAPSMATSAASPPLRPTGFQLWFLLRFQAHKHTESAVHSFQPPAPVYSAFLTPASVFFSSPKTPASRLFSTSSLLLEPPKTSRTFQSRVFPVVLPTNHHWLYSANTQLTNNTITNSKY